MSEQRKYTPAPHEARARFISGSIDLIRRRDNCTLAEAEDTAIGEWERWMEWHNVRVRRGVVTEEPEWEWMVTTTFDYCDPIGSGPTDEETARAIMRWSEDDGLERELYRRHPATEWVPVEQEGAET